MSGSIEFAMNFGAGDGRRRQTGQGGRIYLIGDFSGAAGRDAAQPGFIRIDRDNFDAVFAKLKPTLTPQPAVKLEFTALEDFHPDAWLHQVKATADLLQLKRQLQNPATAAQAAAHIEALLPATAASDRPEAAPQPAAEVGDQMWLRLLGKVPEDSQQSPDLLSQWLQQTVSPHSVQPVSPQQQDWLRLIDLMLSQFCRLILHDADFQQLEALWLATLALLQEEQAEAYSVFLIDLDQASLRQTLSDPTAGFVERLASHIASADDQGEVLLVADVVFGAGSGEGQLLQQCLGLARRCGGRLIAGVDAEFCQQRMAAAGTSPAIDADLLLTFPRYLARLPYGPKTDAIDGFDFVETPDQPASADLLWSNGGFLLARTLMRGAADDAGLFGDVAVFSYSRDGEPVLQAATETLLTEAQANALLAGGIVPLIGFRQRQGLRVLFR